MAHKKQNPFVNGFRLEKDVYDFFARRAQQERRTIADVIRLALTDHAKECAPRGVEGARQTVRA